MTDEAIEILAQQVDMMAEQAEVMRVQIQELLALLGRNQALAALGIADWELTRLNDPTPREMNRWRHSKARNETEREAAIDQLLLEAKTRRKRVGL